eukprot:96990-Rhodomonas_salina.1
MHELTTGRAVGWYRAAACQHRVCRMSVPCMPYVSTVLAVCQYRTYRSQNPYVSTRHTLRQHWGCPMVLPDVA